MNRVDRFAVAGEATGAVETMGPSRTAAAAAPRASSAIGRLVNRSAVAGEHLVGAEDEAAGTTCG